jgi:hypothetical protein
MFMWLVVCPEGAGNPVFPDQPNAAIVEHDAFFVMFLEIWLLCGTSAEFRAMHESAEARKNHLSSGELD